MNHEDWWRKRADAKRDGHSEAGDRHQKEGCQSPVLSCRLPSVVDHYDLSLFCPSGFSSVDWMGPIRDTRPGNLAGMHAIGWIFGSNNLGTDAGKQEWLIRSVFKEE